MLTINRFVMVKPLNQQNKIIHNKTGIIVGIYGNRYNPNYFDVKIKGYSYLLLKDELSII
jgi:hypothetical protein